MRSGPTASVGLRRLRRAFGLVIGLVSSIVVVQGARVGRSQWLAYSADIPGVSPVGSPEDLAHAAILAPRSGPLSLWNARLAHQEFLSAWLSPSALAAAETAAETARSALRAHPGNPYAHIHIARVALDHARHPRSDEDFGGSLRSQAPARLAVALRLYPSSADVGERVATLLLPEWAVLDRSARQVALEGIRQVGKLDRLRFPRLLAELAEALVAGWSTERRVIETLRGATPKNLWALNALSRQLLVLAGTPPADAPEAWSRRAVEVAVASLADAALASRFEPNWVQRWIETSLQRLPDKTVDLLKGTRVATTNSPAAAGAWMARAWAASAAGLTDEARDAAKRARNLARAALTHGLVLASDGSENRGALTDAELLSLAETRIGELRATHNSEGKIRATLHSGQEALRHAMKLLAKLRSAGDALP